MIEKVLQKLNNNRGESLIEILASILVISLAVTIATGAVLTSAKIDNNIKNNSHIFSEDNVKNLITSNATLNISLINATNSDISIRSETQNNIYLYQYSDGAYFYEYVS